MRLPIFFFTGHVPLPRLKDNRQDALDEDEQDYHCEVVHYDRKGGVSYTIFLRWSSGSNVGH